MTKHSQQNKIIITILLIFCAIIGLIILPYGGIALTQLRIQLNNLSQPVGTISNAIMMGSTGLFFLTVFFYLVIEKRNKNNRGIITHENYKNRFLGWVFGSITLSIFSIVAIVIMNPRGLYGTRLFEPRWLLVRPIKVEYYLDLQSTPDMVILGSSRTFTISPGYIYDRFRYTAFNASFEGSRLDELPIFLKFIAAHSGNTFPKILLIEAPPYLLEGISPERMPSSLLCYMRFTDKLNWWYVRYDGLFDLDQLSESFYSALREPKESHDWTFQFDGQGILPSTSNEQLNQHVDQAIEAGPPDCRLPSRRAVSNYRELVSIATNYKASIIFIITPFHPRYYNSFMAPGSQFYSCKTEAIQLLENLAQENRNIFFLDYSDLASIGGVPTAEGYYDSQHITQYNANLLIDAARDTINQAYQLATEWRGH